MKEKDIKKVLHRLEKEYGHPECALHYSSVFQLLVATILSAQCTDERVNIVTAELFKKYSKPAQFAGIPLKTLEQYIYSTGFYRNKARSIKEASQRIEKKFGGTVPGTMEELLTLRGVSRKTANVVLQHGFNRSAGIVVDTHVKRIAARLGFTREENPGKIERDLMTKIPESYWMQTSSLLIRHGRQVCKARKPLCPACPIAKLCEYPDKQSG